MKTRKDKRDRIEEALRREGLHGIVCAIDRGEDGEVLLWAGGAGHPVHNVREALTLVRRWAA